MKFASRLAENNFTVHCVPGKYTHSPTKQTYQLALYHFPLSLMLPCCFSDTQLCSRWQMEETTVVMHGRPHSKWTLLNQPQTARKAYLNRPISVILWLFAHSSSWMTMFSHSIMSYKLWQIIHSVLICIYVNGHVWIPDSHNDSRICMSVASWWEDKPLKRPISMMVAALIWMILSSSVHLHKTRP